MPAHRFNLTHLARLLPGRLHERPSGRLAHLDSERRQAEAKAEAQAKKKEKTMSTYKWHVPSLELMTQHFARLQLGSADAQQLVGSSSDAQQQWLTSLFESDKALASDLNKYSAALVVCSFYANFGRSRHMAFFVTNIFGTCASAT